MAKAKKSAEHKNSGNTSLNMQENVEALLAYLFGWVTGIIFLILEKKSKFVRFHAMQSTVFFLLVTAVYSVMSWILIFGWIINVIGVLTFILWIVLMIKAYQNEKFKIPIIGDFSEKNSEKLRFE